MNLTWLVPMKMLSLLFKEFVEVIYDLLPLDIENLLEGKLSRELGGVCVGINIAFLWRKLRGLNWIFAKMPEEGFSKNQFESL